MITEAIRPIAKAVAAFVVPWVLFVAAWLADAVGAPVNVDAQAVEVFVVAAVTGAAVYVKRNTPKLSLPQAPEAGE